MQINAVTGAYPLDIDADGLMDLAVLRAGENLLLRGRGDCAFEVANAEFGFDGGDGWTTAFSATWEDGNRLPTLAFGNYVDRDDPDGPFNACDDNVLLRPAGPTASRYGAPVSLAGYCTLSMLFTDWNRSGQPSLRVSNDRHYYVRRRGGAALAHGFGLPASTAARTAGSDCAFSAWALRLTTSPGTAIPSTC